MSQQMLQFSVFIFDIGLKFYFEVVFAHFLFVVELSTTF